VLPATHSESSASCTARESLPLVFDNVLLPIPQLRLTVTPFSLLLPAAAFFLLHPLALRRLFRSATSSPTSTQSRIQLQKMASLLETAEMPKLDPNHARIVESWLRAAAQQRRHMRRNIAVQSPESSELAREAEISGLSENTRQVLQNWYAKKLRGCLEIEQQTLHRFQQYAVEYAESSRDPARTVALHDQVKSHLRCLSQTQIVYMHDAVGGWLGWMTEFEEMQKAGPTNIVWCWKNIC